MEISMEISTFTNFFTNSRFEIHKLREPYSLGTLQTLPSADVGGLGGGEGDADASPGGAIASSAVPTNDVP